MMDPFTDMLTAFANGRIDVIDLYNWCNEWRDTMSNPMLVCRAHEMGTQLCANAMEMLIRLTW